MPSVGESVNGSISASVTARAAIQNVGEVLLFMVYLRTDLTSGGLLPWRPQGRDA